MKDKKTLLDKTIEKLPQSLRPLFGLLFFASIIGFFALAFIFVFFPNAINTVTIVLFVICLAFGGIPLIISCIQVTDKEDVKAAMKPTQLPNTPLTKDGSAIHCPTCNSTNVEKISTVSRAASIYAFGLYSGKIGKQFKCKNCGYKW